MIFVDTGILVAAFSRFDPEHSWARAFLFAPKDSLATSDYVIDETLTLLRSRGHYFDYLGVRGCVVRFDQQGAVASTSLF